MDDLYDEFAGFPSVDIFSGTPIDFDWGNVDFGNIDWKNFDWSNFDLSKLKDFGFDLSNLEGIDFGKFDLSDLFGWGADVGLDGIDLSSIGLDIPYQDLEDTGTLLNQELATIPGIEGFAGASDEVGGAGSGTFVPAVDPYEVDQQTSRDEATALIPTTPERDPFEVDQQTSRDETAALTPTTPTRDPFESDQQTSRDETTALTPVATEVDPYEVDQQTSRDETTALTPAVTEKDPYEVDEQTSRDETTALNKDNAMLYALLGGLMGLLGRGSTPKGPVGYQGGIPKYTARRVPGRGVEYTRAAQGGLMGLADKEHPIKAAKGGQYLKGSSDGMADDIYTNIDGKQPARLSSGEFVLSADVVSALGGGNSDAGAEVLYDMMDRVRKNAYGRKKQINPVNKRKVLPA